MWRWRTAFGHQVAICALVIAILLRVINGTDRDGSTFGALGTALMFMFTNAGARCGSVATIRIAKIIRDTEVGESGFVNDGINMKISQPTWGRTQEEVGQLSGRTTMEITSHRMFGGGHTMIRLVTLDKQN